MHNKYCYICRKHDKLTMINLQGVQGYLALQLNDNKH